MQPWERQERESARAYRAFAIYRDLGSARSIDRAYRDSGDGAVHSRSSGTWNAWSSQFGWAERATAYDAHLDGERRRVREAKLLQLEERRAEYEFSNQERLERRVSRMEAILDKADVAPITDLNQKKTEEDIALAKRTTTITKVKGISFAGYARLVKETNETSRQAIEGPRKNTAADAGSAAALPPLIVEVADESRTDPSPADPAAEPGLAK